MARVAEATAAVLWLAPLFELAATRRRFVTAVSPKTSTTTATSASTSVKPASAPGSTLSRVGWFMLGTSLLRQHAAAGGDANGALEAGRGLAHPDLHGADGGGVAPGVVPVGRAPVEHRGLRRRRPLGHRDRRPAGAGERRGVAEPPETLEAEGGAGG